MPFPNVATQFKKGTSGFPAGRPKPAVGRRKVRAIRAAIRRAEALREDGPEPFDGNALSLLQQIYRDPKMPLDLRIACANSAVRFEAATPASDQPEMTPEQRRQRITVLIEQTGLGVPAPPEPAMIEGEVVDVEPEQRIAAMEAEKRDLLRQLAAAEARQELQRKAADLEARLRGGVAPAVAVASTPVVDPYGRAWDSAQGWVQQQPSQPQNALARCWDPKSWKS